MAEKCVCACGNAFPFSLWREWQDSLAHGLARSLRVVVYGFYVAFVVISSDINWVRRHPLGGKGHRNMSASRPGYIMCTYVAVCMAAPCPLCARWRWSLVRKRVRPLPSSTSLPSSLCMPATGHRDDAPRGGHRSLHRHTHTRARLCVVDWKSWRGIKDRKEAISKSAPARSPRVVVGQEW